MPTALIPMSDDERDALDREPLDTAAGRTPVAARQEPSREASNQAAIPYGCEVCR